MTDSAEYLDHIFQQQKKAFLTAQYPTLEQRRTWLKQLKTLLLKHQDTIIAAISAAVATVMGSGAVIHGIRRVSKPAAGSRRGSWGDAGVREHTTPFM